MSDLEFLKIIASACDTDAKNVKYVVIDMKDKTMKVEFFNYIQSKDRDNWQFNGWMREFGK
jgi:hypothetical protein